MLHNFSFHVHVIIKLFSELLWTAPEHLRNSDGTIGVSQKGDVYSFGIILQEISQRSAPYDSNNLSAEG